MIKNKTGSTQSMAILITAIVTLVALAIFIIFFVSSRLQAHKVNQALAKEVAEYGLTIALKKIDEDPNWRQGLSNVKYRNGHFTVTIDKTGDNEFTAISQGTVEKVTKSVIFSYTLEMNEGVLKPKKLDLKYK